jgi:hypothetical protein
VKKENSSGEPGSVLGGSGTRKWRLLWGWVPGAASRTGRQVLQLARRDDAHQLGSSRNAFDHLRIGHRLAAGQQHRVRRVVAAWTNQASRASASGRSNSIHSRVMRESSTRSRRRAHTA